MLGVFAGIFGQKLALIDQYGSDLPFWDAWDGEGDVVFKPYMEGHLPASVWVKPHNEHRILFTRALALGLLVANDHQWDGRLELVANAALHAGVVALLIGFAVGVAPGWVACILAGAAVYLAGSPVDNENTLAGFQSQFYFLLLIPGLHVWLATTSKPGSKAYRLSPLLGLAAVFTMASGFFSAAALLGVACLRFVRERTLSKDLLWLALPNLLLVALGLALKVDVAGHESLRAASAGGWFASLLHQASWPVIDLWFAPIGAAAFLVYLTAFLRGRLTEPRQLTLLGFGIWVWLQYAAIAYARGANGFGYASRYTDILTAAVLLNTLLFAVVSLRACAKRVCYGIALAGGLYLALVLWNYPHLIAQARIEPLSSLKAVNQARIDSVRDYVASQDPAFFAKQPWSELPYPESHRLAQLLDDPSIRSILPRSVRTPPPVSVDPAASRGFSDYPDGGPAQAPPEHLAAFASGIATAATGTLLTTTPFTADHPVVSVFVAGTASDVSLWLDQDGKRIAPRGDPVLSPNRWRRVNFSASHGDYRLCLQSNGNGWVAVTGPVTDAALSRAALALTQASRPWTWLALLCGLGALALALGFPKGLDRRGPPAAL